MKRTGVSEGWIISVSCKLTPPSLKDNTADADRLKRGLEKALQGDEVALDLSLIRRVPALLRSYAYEVHALLYHQGGSWRLFEILPGRAEFSIYGLAVDLGSSTIALRLIDLAAQEIVDEVSFHNPQNGIGPDILTRIHFASQEGGLRRLQDLVVERLNQEIRVLAERPRISTEAIVGMSLAGNTTMTHLFLGLDPHWICREPYIPAVNRPPILPSNELGLAIHPDAPVLVFPNVGSYFGGDLIAGILVSGMGRQDDLSILVDVGTNAEVVLGNKDWLVACAGAAGPALEGGVADMGMMAGPGVIDKVSIGPDSQSFRIRTIENKPPIGICGSGLIDLAAQLFLAGMIDLRGKFVWSECGERLREMEGIKVLVVVPSQASGTGRDLTLSQTDIDALIRSKAAMFTILTTITRVVNIPMKELVHFYIAGTFGSFIDPGSAITLGMIPDLPLETYKPLGNTSLEGAAQVLLSAAAREEIYEIHDRVTYVELNVNQEFMNLFSAAKFIPHTDRSLFPSVRPSQPGTEAMDLSR
ncbi:MAG: ASKHA domain-containing protein [Desulfobacterales bacterium]|nr:ASKHA domain-containing protein [Desulfobacterales bacterium]